MVKNKKEINQLFNDSSIKFFKIAFDSLSKADT